MSEPKDVLPGHETQSDEMNCPACGRFVGAVTKCPYCGAKVSKRMSLVVTRWAAVLLATVGLFLLYLMAIHREVPLVKLGEIEPTWNFGLVRVSGTVASDARPFKSGRGMSFNVDDGTGRMVVFTTERQMTELQEQNLVPKAGDSIDFVAQLNISEDKSNLKLSGLNSYSLTRAPAMTIPLSGVTSKLEGKAVEISGQVVSLTPPPADSKRPYSLKLSDGTGEVEISFWETEYAQLPNPEGLQAGVWVKARVEVSSYKQKLQLKLSSGKDVEILEAAPAAPYQSPAQKAAAKMEAAKPATAPARDFSRGRLAEVEAISAITTDREGDRVKVSGTVVFINADKKPQQPFNVIVKDEAGDSIYLTYWDSVDAELAEKPSVGAIVEAEGEVKVFRDKPQIQIFKGAQLRKLGVAPAPAKTRAATAAASSANVRKGTLGAPRDLNGKGTAYSFTSGDSTVDLVLWNDTLDPAPVLKEGMTVEVEGGKEGAYQGQAQLIITKYTRIREVK